MEERLIFLYWQLLPWGDEVVTGLRTDEIVR
jgi:hypothetical protein